MLTILLQGIKWGLAISPMRCLAIANEILGLIDTRFSATSDAPSEHIDDLFDGDREDDGHLLSLNMMQNILSGKQQPPVAPPSDHHTWYVLLGKSYNREVTRE